MAGGGTRTVGWAAWGRDDAHVQWGVETPCVVPFLSEPASLVTVTHSAKPCASELLQQHGRRGGLRWALGLGARPGSQGAHGRWLAVCASTRRRPRAFVPSGVTALVGVQKQNNDILWCCHFVTAPRGRPRVRRGVPGTQSRRRSRWGRHLDPRQGRWARRTHCRDEGAGAARPSSLGHVWHSRCVCRRSRDARCSEAEGGMAPEEWLLVRRRYGCGRPEAPAAIPPCTPCSESCQTAQPWPPWVLSLCRTWGFQTKLARCCFRVRRSRCTGLWVSF